MMTSRRQFNFLLGGVAVAWPLAASAEQTTKIHRIGFLWDSPAAFPEAMLAFRQQMRGLGYVEDRNLLIDYR
jgi:putative ABC transport system substrate-binding protein